MFRPRSCRILLIALVFLISCVSFSSYLRSFFNPVSLAASITKSIQPASTYAFATFLSTRLANESDHDPYFTATRVLAYQLLHQPETRTRQAIPFVVLVPPHVSETKRKILREDGATVIPVDLIIPPSWTPHPTEDRWIDQFTKLRLFSFTEYARILYMDSDMLITRRLDDVWNEETVRIPRKTEDNSPDSTTSKLPTDYVIAGVTDNERPGRKRPTRITSRSRLNAGFLVFKPDTALFNYYISLLEQPEPVFDQSFMEMGLLNYAHRSDGPMPWVALPPGQYSNNWPQMVDVEMGSATLHDKFWVSANKDWIDRELVEMWWRVQGRMEGYWQGKGRAKV